MPLVAFCHVRLVVTLTGGGGEVVEAIELINAFRGCVLLDARNAASAGDGRDVIAAVKSQAFVPIDHSRPHACVSRSPTVSPSATARRASAKVSSDIDGGGMCEGVADP